MDGSAVSFFGRDTAGHRAVSTGPGSRSPWADIAVSPHSPRFQGKILKKERTKMSDKLVIIGTHAEENPDKATLPFVVGNAALAMDIEVVVMLQSMGVYLAKTGYANHVHAAGFPPLSELFEAFFEAGGKLMVCSPCIQARKISEEDLIPESQVIAGGTLVLETLSATNVISY
jgi:uncharacterized protein involved in oxidation of intracellular sulfur